MGSGTWIALLSVNAMLSFTRSNSRFANRREAGRALAASLQLYAGRDDIVILGLPRGGVPVAHEVAVALRAPLDVFVVRKLGVPGHPELAMGALASGGIRVLTETATAYDVSPDDIEAVTRREQQELERREAAYRGDRPLLAVDGKIVILVDDGLATGATMQAAVAAVRRLRPHRVIVAVPVGARDSCDELSDLADAVVCPRTPFPFSAVGLWYDDFSQTTDEEVRELLLEARAAPRARDRS
jgi:putative phosphoribosyl transferase